MNSSILKRFSSLGFFSAVAATLILALSVALTIIFTDGLRAWPGLPLTTMLTVSATASWFGWSYFGTSRAAHGWIVAGLFAAFGLPMVFLALFYGFYTSLGTVFLFPVVLSAGLARELRRRKNEKASAINGAA